MQKYYGEKEIESSREDPCNPDRLILSFKGGSGIELSKLLANEVITNEPLDATKLRDKRCFPVVAQILNVLLNYDIHMSEIDFIYQRVIMSVNESIAKADGIIWGKDRNYRSMSDVDRVLRSVPKPEDGIPSPIDPRK